MKDKCVGANLVGMYTFCSDATIFTLIYSQIYNVLIYSNQYKLIDIILVPF